MEIQFLQKEAKLVYDTDENTIGGGEKKKKTPEESSTAKFSC